MLRNIDPMPTGERLVTVDSHQHFWKIDRGDYGWMGPHVAPLMRDFLPDELRPLLARAGIDRTVVVQAADGGRRLRVPRRRRAGLAVRGGAAAT